MVDEATKVEIVKIDAVSGDRIEGAVFELSDDSGVIKTFTVGKDGYIILGELNVDTTYTLHEKTAPKDYEPTEDITFSIAKDGSKKEKQQRKGLICVEQML